MKNIKKLLMVLAAGVLCIAMTACAGGGGAQVATLETSSAESEAADKDPAKYDNDIQGLCKFFEESGLVAGEKVQMSFDVIGALNGYKYMYRYNDSSVQLELYEFGTEALSDTAKGVLASARDKGEFEILGNTVPAALTEDNRFMMIYTDAKAEKDEISRAHHERVREQLQAFAEQAE